MIKLVGSVFIFFGCAAMGFSIALTHKRNAYILQQFLLAVEFMLCELPEKMPPLPILLRDTAQHTSGIARQIFSDLASILDAQEYANTELSMKTIVERYHTLPEAAKNNLLRLGQSLGRFDIPGQVSGLISIKQSVERELNALLTNMEVRIRSYKTLGLCAGAALAILFI